MDDYTEYIVNELGLDQHTPEERDQLLAEVTEVLFVASMRKVWNMLSSEQQDTLTTLFEQSTLNPESTDAQTAVLSYLRKHVPDFKKYMAEELRAFLKVQKEVYTEMSS